MSSALIAFLRAGLLMYCNSLRLALIIVAINLALGPWLVQVWTDWLPLIAPCIGTLALFPFQGIAMRLVLLVAATLPLINTILVGSIGGTGLEILIISANLTTIWRLWCARGNLGVGRGGQICGRRLAAQGVIARTATRSAEPGPARNARPPSVERAACCRRTEARYSISAQ